MNMSNRAIVVRHVRTCYAQLQRSERGRRVCADLLAMIEGPFTGLDGNNVDAVLELTRHASTHPTTVMQALRGEDIE